MVLPAYKDNSSYKLKYGLIYLSIAILNVVNTILLDKMAAVYHNNMYMKNLSDQIEYQKEKYSQLSESYKTSRRVIHDTKKHYFEIQEHIKNGEYECLLSYLNSAMSDLENTYTKYNTGNLVIDSFFTNYENISSKKNIKFNANLKINLEKIPIDDYELCIIIGNMLDNCINACTSDTPGQKFINFSIFNTASNQFILHSDNTYDKCTSKSSLIVNCDPLGHGYGLHNIQTIVDKYNGIMKTTADETFKVTIIIPILNIKREKLL